MTDILITGPMPDVERGLESRFTLHRLWQAEDREALLAQVGPSITGLAVSSSGGPLGEALLSRLPNLQIAASFGVGYDHVNIPDVTARRLIVTNTPGVLTEEVADLTLGLLLATLRQIPAAERHVREGLWTQRAFPLSPSLRGRSVGILGLGDIGLATARRLEAFGVEISYHTRHAKPVPYTYYDSPVALASAVDVLIVLTPGGPATRHLVGAPVLTALGPDGVLINVARGSVVDTEALIDALQNGTILSAGLDVFEDEPRVPQALIDMPHVVLLPHIGSASLVTRAAMSQLVVDNLVSWFDTGAPVTPIAETRAFLR
jgi:lactate dehydrogenase-like 2-hydroxyacid dehydrogenase